MFIALNTGASIDGALEVAWGVVLITLAMAFVVMGLVEAYKQMRRAGFHRQELEKWFSFLGQEADEAYSEASETQRTLDLETMEGLFAAYGEDRNGNIVYSLPRKLFLRVIENAAHLVQEQPQTYEGELYCLARGADPEVRRRYKTAHHNTVMAAAMQSDLAADALTDRQIVTAVHSAIERNLDAFQLALSQRWLNEVRAVSAAAGILVGVLSGMLRPDDIFLMLFLGLLSGFTAMLMHDLLASLTGKGSDQI